MKQLTVVLVGAVLCAPCLALAGGAISGTVAFSGQIPPRPYVPILDSFCKKHKEAIKNGSVPVQGTAGKLQNVVVHLLDAPSGKVPESPVAITSSDCMYNPRVVPAVEGQKVTLTNQDGTIHIVKAWAGKEQLFEVKQGIGAAPVTQDVKAGTKVLKLTCDEHSWMTSYVVFSKSPYFAVTNSGGRFEIKDVPPGTYTLEAWHEKFGSQTFKVSVAEGQTTELDFHLPDPNSPQVPKKQ